MKYSPEELEGLYKDAISTIAIKDREQAAMGGLILKEIIEQFRELKLNENLLHNYMESIEHEVSELFNPWFADARMKDALAVANEQGVNYVRA